MDIRDIIAEEHSNIKAGKDKKARSIESADIIPSYKLIMKSLGSLSFKFHPMSSEAAMISILKEIVLYSNKGQWGKVNGLAKSIESEIADALTRWNPEDGYIDP